MKKFNVLIALLFIYFVFAASSARAQNSAADKPFSFGAELEGLLPLGSFGDAASPGAGADLKIKYKLPNIDGSITGTIGFNYFAPKSDAGDIKYSGIPVKIGYLATFSEKFTIEPQIGFYNLRAAEDGDSASNTDFLIGAQLGYNVTNGSNIGVGYYHISADGGSLAFVGLHYCFTF